MATCYPSQFTILSLHQQSTEPKNIFDFCPTGTFQSKLGNMKFTLIAILAVVGVVIALPAGKKQDYPLKLQPELDVVNIDDYLRNERLLDLQIKCVLGNKKIPQLKSSDFHVSNFLKQNLHIFTFCRESPL